MNEREFELAQQIEQLQRDAAIELARAQCQGAGSEECRVRRTDPRRSTRMRAVRDALHRMPGTV